MAHNMKLSLEQINKLKALLNNTNGTFHGFNGTLPGLLGGLNHLESSIHHESAFLAPKWIIIILSVVAAFACFSLCWLLRDEWRQAQLRKKGYGVVGTQMQGNA